MLPYGSHESLVLPEIRQLRAEGYDVLVVPELVRRMCA